MATAWPVTLPQSPLSGTWSVQNQDNVLRGPADLGEGPVRPRTTSYSQLVSLQMLMTLTQVQALETFYKTTLESGTARFEFTDILTSTTKEFRFTEPYQVSEVGAGWFRISMSWTRKAE